MADAATSRRLTNRQVWREKLTAVANRMLRRISVVSDEKDQVL
jgi:hypothetical protein